MEQNADNLYIRKIMTRLTIPVLPMPALQWTTMGGPRGWPSQGGVITATISAWSSTLIALVKEISFICFYNASLKELLSSLYESREVFCFHEIKDRMTTCLLLSDTLEELQHGKSRVRGAIVRPTCELQTTLLAFLTVGDDIEMARHGYGKANGKGMIKG